jgi:cobalt-zinc-cadmium efflux system outer membrane protein
MGHGRQITAMLTLALALFGAGDRGFGQVPTIDVEIRQPPGAGSSLMGASPGAGRGQITNVPGADALLGGRAGPSVPHGVPAAITNPGGTTPPTAMQRAIVAPEVEPITPSSAGLYGTLAIPSGAEDDGPPDGLTLDKAIDIMLARSLDLRAKFFEIPQARADILQASLRSNPAVYADGQLIQYAGNSFSRVVAGGPTQYDLNVTYPLDVSRKRQARTMVAVRAEKVLEAQYQEAIRQKIDDVYDVFVSALAARQTVRFAQESVKGLSALLNRNEDLYKKGAVSLPDLRRVRIQLSTARLGLVDAQSAYRKTKIQLGSVLNLSQAEIEAFELRGSIRDTAPEPPPVEELRRIALESRPDILSYRLGVKRAEADVRLAKATRLNDVYVLFQPYTYQDNTPYGLKGAISWALGVTAPLPVFNRNQGGIERAKLNVAQTQVELSDVERQALIDVEQAIEEYRATRREVDELRTDVIPDATRIREQAYELYQTGVESAVDYINAQREFNLVAKQYLDTASRHRRAMLSVNTAVGQRILP